MLIELLLLASSIDDNALRPDGCELEAPVRDPAVCQPVYQDESISIYSVESVAVGSFEQMETLRPHARACGLSNRIDGVGTEIGVFDIINATAESRDCMISWITVNAPELAFTKEKLNALLRSPDPDEEAPTS